MLNFEDIKTLWIKLFFSAKLLSHFSRVRLCATPQTTAHQAPRPWDSPGKNTGVGCHFLLQCMKVKSESEFIQLCSTLCDSMDCSLPGSSIHGILQARVLEWGAIAFYFTQNSVSEIPLGTCVERLNFGYSSAALWES